MIGWHVAWDWAAGGCRRRLLQAAGPRSLQLSGNQNGIDLKAICNLAIGVPLFWNYKLSFGLGLGFG